MWKVGLRNAAVSVLVSEVVSFRWRYEIGEHISHFRHGLAGIFACPDQFYIACDGQVFEAAIDKVATVRIHAAFIGDNCCATVDRSDITDGNISIDFSVRLQPDTGESLGDSYIVHFHIIDRRQVRAGLVDIVCRRAISCFKSDSDTFHRFNLIDVDLVSSEYLHCSITGMGILEDDVFYCSLNGGTTLGEVAYYCVIHPE